MHKSQSIQALRRANPRARDGFASSVEAATQAVRSHLDAAPEDAAVGPVRSRGRRLRVVAGTSLAAAVAAAVILAVGQPGGSPGVESAAAAVKKAVTVTAASAERSGTAVVRMTHGDKLWGGTTIRWHGDDVAIWSDAPQRAGKAGSMILVVNGVLYGTDPESKGRWIDMGSPASIDLDSGTTPAEYLAAVREDVGGATLRRITKDMSGLTSRELADGSIVYSGTVAAGLIARETGFKEGHAIRVLPFGYVANDEAADPSAPLAVAVTVGTGGVVREIAVSWGTWTYTVAYDRLGATSALKAPAHARSLLEERLRKAAARG
jgi:hypothetical protein